MHVFTRHVKVMFVEGALKPQSPLVGRGPGMG